MDVAFRRPVKQARRQGDLDFASPLAEDRIRQAFGRARWFRQSWIYSPAVTIWVFLSPCLSADHSRRDAHLAALRPASGQGAETLSGLDAPHTARRVIASPKKPAGI